MRSELNQMEEELVQCKKLREKQETDFNHKLLEEKKSTERQISELRVKHDQDLAEIRRKHSAEVEKVKKEIEKTRVRGTMNVKRIVVYKYCQVFNYVTKIGLILLQETEVAKLSSSLTECEAQAKAKAVHSAMVISSLENENRGLKQQLEELRSSYEQKIREMNLTANEEGKNRDRIHETTVCLVLKLIVLTLS